MKGRSSTFSFTQVPQANIPRSTFDMSRGNKLTLDAGWLVPIFVEEALPGDTFNVRASIAARLATPLLPLMDNIVMDFFWFAIPNRLVWNNWQRFCGEQDDPDDPVDFLIPQASPVMNPSGAPTGTEAEALLLYDFLGVPSYMGVPGSTVTVNNLFARAYNAVFNEFFRDENLVDRAVVDKDDGPDLWTDYYIRNRCKKHDYFTSALPWPQKGPGAMIPITGMPVVATAGAFPQFGKNAVFGYIQATTSAANTPANLSEAGLPVNQPLTWGSPGLEVGMGTTEAGTINALREAQMLQRFMERDARGGTRYIEKVKSHFGVTSPDARLQRPEYLGGGTVPVLFTQVPQTSGTPGAGGYTDTPQGNLAAYATAFGSKSGFVKSFVEHSIILGLVQVRADLTYQQGLHRMFSRRTVHDFYWPTFANLGEQAILNKEIYHQGDGVAANEEVFGYQERWSEYRYGQSRVCNVMRSQHPISTDVWHLAEEFATLPTLSAQFLQTPPPVDRVIAVDAAPQFICDMWFKVRAARPMPLYSVPGGGDRF